MKVVEMVGVEHTVAVAEAEAVLADMPVMAVMAELVVPRDKQAKVVAAAEEAAVETSVAATKLPEVEAAWEFMAKEQTEPVALVPAELMQVLVRAVAAEPPESVGLQDFLEPEEQV